METQYTIAEMSLSFDEIMPDLYIGGLLGIGDWYILASLNITVDINLQAEWQDRFTGTAPEVYLWLPTPDWYGPGIEALHVGTRFIHSMHSVNRKVYVHCHSGSGRAPALAAAYLMLARKMSPEEAIHYVIQRRPATRLNSEQLRQLVAFHQYYLATGSGLT